MTSREDTLLAVFKAVFPLRDNGVGRYARFLAVAKENFRAACNGGPIDKVREGRGNAREGGREK